MSFVDGPGHDQHVGAWERGSFRPAQWAQRNLGINPRDASPGDVEAATATDDGAAIQRELIDFDSESQDLPAFAKAATARPR